METPSRPPVFSLSLIAPLLFLGLLKLWLVWDYETIARLAPHDQSWYLEAAHYIIQGRWLGDYNSMTLIRPPGFPLWIAFIHWTRLPLSMATEITFILSAFLLTASFVKAGLPRLLGVLCYFCMIFLPASFRMNYEMEAENLYAPLLMFSIACMIMLFLEQSWRARILRSTLLAAAYGGLWNLRHENIILLFYLCLFGALLAFFLKTRRQPFSLILKKLAVVLGIPAVFILASSISLKVLNDSHYGIFRTSEILAPGYENLIKALLKIKTEHPRRFVSIPLEVREKAYLVSPSFQKLKPFLEGDIGKGWARFGCETSGVCDDIAAGWFQWALRDSVKALGYYSSAPQTDSFYQTASAEIQFACAKNKIACRGYLLDSSGFLNPTPSTYWKYIPAEFKRMAAQFSFLPPLSQEKDDVESLPDSVRELFDTVANRRIEKTSEPFLEASGKIKVTGWAAHLKGDPLSEIRLMGPEGEVFGTTRPEINRPDVVAHFTRKGVGNVPILNGFELWAALPNTHTVSTLSFLSGKVEVVRVPLRKSIKEDPFFAYAIDSVEGSGVSGESRLKLKSFLFRFLFLPKLLTSLSFLSALVSIVFWKYRSAPPHFFPIVLLLSGIVLARVSLFTLFSSATLTIPDNIIRYTYPVMPIYYCLPFLLLYMAGKSLKKRFGYHA